MENKNGRGIFYGVIGVATLVVAIMGATFAYFSAAATVSGASISGGTNNIANALSAEVSIVYNGATGTGDALATSGSGLVPANIANDAAKINAAVNAKCVNGGYTGCHLYQIKVKSEQDVAGVELKLATLSVVATNNNNWSYVVYKSSADATSDAKTMSGTSILDGKGSSFNLSSAQNIRTDAMTANTYYYYYLLIWIEDTDSSQNGVGTGATNETGTYSGTITFTAAGSGEVRATFAA